MIKNFKVMNIVTHSDRLPICVELNSTFEVVCSLETDELVQFKPIKWKDEFKENYFHIMIHNQSTDNTIKNIYVMNSTLTDTIINSAQNAGMEKANGA